MSHIFHDSILILRFQIWYVINYTSRDVHDRRDWRWPFFFWRVQPRSIRRIWRVPFRTWRTFNPMHHRWCNSKADPAELRLAGDARGFVAPSVCYINSSLAGEAKSHKAIGRSTYKDTSSCCNLGMLLCPGKLSPVQYLALCSLSPHMPHTLTLQARQNVVSLRLPGLSGRRPRNEVQPLQYSRNLAGVSYSLSFSFLLTGRQRPFSIRSTDLRPPFLLERRVVLEILGELLVIQLNSSTPGWRILCLVLECLIEKRYNGIPHAIETDRSRVDNEPVSFDIVRTNGAFDRG
jgi:hypothetical protein